MAFTNDDIQEIREIVQEVIGETADPIDDTNQVDALEEGDIVAIVRAVGGVNSYKKASVGLFGGGSGGSVTVDSALSTTSKNPVQNKVVTAALNGKQATLIGSGTGQNIKTVNGQSLLGTGDIPASGGAGTVPVITATATVDATTGTPAVSVVKSGTDTAPNFAFAFTGLKGEPGSGGGGGGTGTVTGAKVGQDGTVINPDQNGVVTLPAYEANADVTDAENVKNALGVQQGGTRYLKEDGTWDTPAGGGGGGTQKGTKVYLAANGGVLPAMESTNVVYVISYDYTIADSVTVPANCSFEFAGGSINGGALVLNNTYLYGNVKFGTGITVSGTCRNDTAYQKWFSGNNVDAWHRFINNVDVPCYEYEFGSYLPTVYLNKEVENKGCITINGNNATLRYTYEQNASVYTIKPKNADTFTGTSITSAVAKGSTEIPVASASSFSVGDIISVRDNTTYSFSPHRSSYVHCEFATISSISGSTITVSHPLYGTYQHTGSINVYGFNTMTCNINDLTLMVANPSSVSDKFFGLSIYQSFGGRLRNVKTIDYRTGIRLSSCGKSLIEGCLSKVNNIQISSIDSYALSIGNCQNVNIIGGDYTGGNHGVSIGGGNSSIAAISREILVKNVRAKSIKEGFPCAIDMHGCAEYITIEGCVTDGIYLRGKNNKAINNFIYGNGISCDELASLNHTISGNIMKIPTISIKWSTNIDNANWIKDCTEDTFVISGNSSFDSVYTESGSTKSYSLVPFVSAAIDQTYYNIANTTLVVDGNNVRNALNYIGASFSTVVIRNNTFAYDTNITTVPSAYPKLYATNLFLEGNKFINYGYYTGWSYNKFKVSYMFVRNNYAESASTSYALLQSGDAITELYVEGNICKGKFLGVTHSVGRVVIKDNNVEPIEDGINISTGSTALATKAIVKNNIVTAADSIKVFAINTVYGRNVSLTTMALQAPSLLSGATYTNLDAGGGGGEPAAYLKSASVSQDGNTLTLTNKDDTTVMFSPSATPVVITDGVYIEATDGTLVESTDWATAGKTANSILIVDGTWRRRIYIDDSYETDTCFAGSWDVSGCTNETDGSVNTATLRSLGSKPAIVAATFTVGGDTYLPARQELTDIFTHLTEINACRTALGKSALPTGNYWSSTYRSYESSKYYLYIVNTDGTNNKGGASGNAMLYIKVGKY